MHIDKACFEKIIERVLIKEKISSMSYQRLCLMVKGKYLLFLLPLVMLSNQICKVFQTHKIDFLGCIATFIFFYFFADYTKKLKSLLPSFISCYSDITDVCFVQDKMIIESGDEIPYLEMSYRAYAYCRWNAKYLAFYDKSSHLSVFLPIFQLTRKQKTDLHNFLQSRLEIRKGLTCA